MALVLKDRVKESTATTGTGTYTLAGAVTGFEAFSSIGNSNTTYYVCTDGTDFEVGIGTYTSSGTTLARTTILESSNSDSAVSWSSGSKTIFCSQPAEKAVFLNASNNLDISGDVDVDGTLEADAVTVNGTALSTVIAGTTVANATLAATVTVTDSTANTNFPVVFHDESNGLLDDTGELRYNPSTGELLAPKLNVAGTDLFVSRNADVSGAITGASVTVDDVAIDGKVITMTGSSGDTVVFTAGTNGTLSIVTTDAAAAAANIQITADGTAELAGTTVTLDSSGGITLDADGGTITFADAGSSLGTITSDGFTGNVVGNVTGNTSGTAATVTGAAQSNITSLGTLTTLTVDNVIINGTTIGHTDDTDLITVADGVVTVAGEVSMTTLDIGGTNVTSTAAELNYSDTGASVGTVVASKVVTVDANKDVASFRNITLTGELDAGSLDVSGDADIDGTLEADAITVNGTALNTVIADEATALAIALG